MSQPPTKQFHIGDILSVTTGRLVSPDHMSGLQALLEWMAGEPIWTHQLGRVAVEATPTLRAAFPDLAAIEPTDEQMASKTTVEAWLADIVAKHGTHRDVPRIPQGQHVAVDPISELVDMVGADRVIPVVVSETE